MRRPAEASAAARFTAVVVLPTPPLLLTTATITGNFSVIISRTPQATCRALQWKCPQNPPQVTTADTVNDRDPNSARASVRDFRTAERGGCGGMGWLGWFRRGANGGDPHIEQWRKDWEAACAAPSREQAEALRSRLDDLGPVEERYEIEREMVDGLAAVAELWSVVSAQGL